MRDPNRMDPGIADSDIGTKKPDRAAKLACFVFA
jgi:hypothetical protein